MKPLGVISAKFETGKSRVIRHEQVSSGNFDLIQNVAPPVDYQTSIKLLDTLKTEHILKKNRSDGILPNRGELMVRDFEQYLDLLPKPYIINKAQTVYSLYPYRHLLGGLVAPAGGARLTSAIGTAIDVNFTAELLGITYSFENREPTFNHFAGTSAGSIIASAMAARAPLKSLYKFCEESYAEFTDNPTRFLERVGLPLKDGYYYATGKKLGENEDLTPAHLRELGSKLYILIGEKGNGYLSDIFPGKTFFLPDSIPGYETQLWSNSIPELVRSSCNIKALFGTKSKFSLSNPLTSEKKDVIDPGVMERELFPLHVQEFLIDAFLESIKNNRANNSEIYYPPMLFSTGYRKTTVPVSENNYGKVNSSTAKLWLYAGVVQGIDIYNYLTGNRIIDRVLSLGTERAHIEAQCRIKDPERPGRAIKIDSGTFNLSFEDFKKLIFKNILSANSQLAEKLVDRRFIESAGKAGKAGYLLWLDDVIAANRERLRLAPAVETEAVVNDYYRDSFALRLAKGTLSIFL